MDDLKFVITMRPGNTNDVAIAGPLDNKGICVMMLELARDKLNEFHARRPEETVAVAQGEVSQILLAPGAKR